AATASGTAALPVPSSAAWASFTPIWTRRLLAIKEPGDGPMRTPLPNRSFSSPKRRWRMRVAACPYPVITIRLALDAGAPALPSTGVPAYRRYVPRMGRDPAPMTAGHAAAARRGQAWVAAEDGRAAGFIILTPPPGYLPLENVAVRPAAQGRGVGARLLALAEEHARSLHLPEIRLSTNEAMTENLAYYPRHGYTDTHRAQQDGFRRVFFRKHLDT